MSAESELATKYLVQLDSLSFHQQELERVQNTNKVELQKLIDLEEQLKSCVSRERPRLLVQGDYRRYVLVSNDCGLWSSARYASVEVLQVAE